MRIYSKILLLSQLSTDGCERPPVHMLDTGAWVDLPSSVDERGRYLARLYDIDPDMRVGLLYANREDFHAKTQGKYLS